MKPSEIIIKEGWDYDGESGVSMHAVLIDRLSQVDYSYIARSLGSSVRTWEREKGRTTTQVVSKLKEFGL